MLASLKNIDYRIAIKTGIAASCSYFIAKSYAPYFSRPDILISGLWCVVATIVVMQANIGSTYKAGLIRFIGVILGSAIGSLIAMFLGVSLVTLGLAVALAIMLCSLLKLKDAYRITGLSVAVVMLSWVVHPEANPWVLFFFRSLDATLGILVAILISHIVWPEQAWLTVNNQFLKALQIAKSCYHDGVKPEASQMHAHELSELFNVLSKLRGELDDIKLDFFGLGRERDKWLVVTQESDRLAEAIAVLRGIPKDNLDNMFDESLNGHVSRFIEETQNAFDELQSQRLGTSSSDYTVRLQEQAQELDADLMRFRATSSTRNYPLADVENFYSFFYHLHFVARQLSLIGKELKKEADPS